MPWLADRVGAVASFDNVKLLDVQVDRLRRWFSDGVLFIGYAAHAMSPVGGVGINLAVADAVAAARILAGQLRARRVSTRRLARAVRLVGRTAALRQLAGYLVAIGPLPEHAPRSARRRPPDEVGRHR